MAASRYDLEQRLFAVQEAQRELAAEEALVRKFLGQLAEMERQEDIANSTPPKNG